MATENLSSRALSRALSYVSSYWIPLNEPLLERLIKLSEEGQYHNESELLVQEIATDIGLFSRCLSYASEVGGFADRSEPMRALESLGAEKLSIILKLIHNDPSTHTIANSSDLQHARIQEVMISASAAETLASSFDVDPKLAFSAGLFRQLGTAMIAWNYPSVYNQAIEELQESPNLGLEKILRDKLGFHPGMLGMKLAESWGLPKRLAQSMIDPDSELAQDGEILIGVGRTLATICRISEALARSNNPEIHPLAESDRETVTQEIEKRLGKNGIQIIQQRFADLCRNYVQVMPDIFRPGLLVDQSFRAPTSYSDIFGEKNPFLPACSTLVRDRLIKLYDALSEGAETAECIRTIVRDLVPTARFSGCSIYTVEPLSMMLELQISTLDGATKVLELEPSSGPISLGHSSLQPIVSFSKRSGESVAGLAWCLGRSNRLGAVYLETGRALFDEAPKKNLIHFKAICQAINDCLKLC